MKSLFLICALCLAAKANAQDADIVALRSRCLPEAPLTTLRAIVRAESNGNPNAMQIDFPKALLRQWHLPNGTLRLKRQPSTQRRSPRLARLPPALRHLRRLGADAGQHRGGPTARASPESLLEPCTNLRVGWQILEDDYRLETKTYGPGQEALQHAISRYNTGDSQRGIDNGYLARVLAARRSLEANAEGAAKR